MSGRRLLLALAVVPAAYAAARLAVAAGTRRIERFDADADELPGTRLYIRGRRLHLVIDGEGPPLLLIHGFGASGFAFRRVARLLDPRFRLLVPDLPGFGFSERSTDADHSYEASADLLLELLDRLGVERTAILGHSIGAAIALRIAAQAPSRVSALVLVSGPGAFDPVLPPVTRPLLSLTVPLIAQSRRAQRWLIASAMAPGGRTDDETVAASVAAARVRGHAATLIHMLAATRHGRPPEPRRIDIPMLVLTGAHDRYFPPRRARAFAARFPQAETAIVPNAGHLVLDEQPERCAAAIARFLRRFYCTASTDATGRA